MSNRSGPWATLRTPATFVANDAWYQMDADTDLGQSASCIRLYVTAGIQSVGNLDFYIQHSPDHGTTWYDYCIEGTSPHIWGSLVFTSPGAKSIELTGLNLYPTEAVRVFYRASAGAGAATLEVKSLSFRPDHTASPQRVTIYSPTDADGSVEVAIQDQHTPPLDSEFAQEVSPFTLAADTIASGQTTLQYTFVATTGHGLAAGDEVLLLDPLASTSFFAMVMSVSGDTITIDRPIDHLFPAATSLGRQVITNMAVDGSVTPQIFTVRAGFIPLDGVRVIIQITDDSSMDTSKFGGGPALSAGLVFRICNSFQKTIFNFKTNGEIQQKCYDVDLSSKAPAGFTGLSARISFGGPSKHGITLRIGPDDVLQWIVQDDLTDLVTMKITVQGHEVEL